MGLEIRPVTREEFASAADVAARALFHIFTHVGPDPADQLAAAYDAYRAIPFEHQTTLGAFAGGHVVAMAKMSEPGNCWCDGLDVAPEPSSKNERGVLAYRRFLAEHHPSEPHWWFGPVGVEPGLQGRGVGTGVMRAALALLDGSRAREAWLEAEPHVAGFYRRIGFTDVIEAKDPDGIELVFQRLVL